MAPNTAPGATLTAPADGTTVVDGTALTVTGTASDNEDGDLGASLSWSSSIDGGLGAGPSVDPTLSVGVHTITASVTDIGGDAGPDQQTADLAPIIEEIVGRAGWVSGNSLALILTGAGSGVATTHNTNSVIF